MRRVQEKAHTLVAEADWAIWRGRSSHLPLSPFRLPQLDVCPACFVKAFRPHFPDASMVETPEQLVLTPEEERELILRMEDLE